MHLRAGNGAEDRGGKPATEPARACSLGAKIGNDLRLLHVFSGSPAEHAGLAANDVLVAIDGIRASASAIESLLRRGVAEMSVSVHAFRRDELIELDLVLAHAPLDTCYLTLRPDAPDACVGLRNAWLTGHVSAFLRFAAPSSDCRWSGTTL